MLLFTILHSMIYFYPGIEYLTFLNIFYCNFIFIEIKRRFLFDDLYL
jgi:hypothetical protein